MPSNRCWHAAGLHADGQVAHFTVHTVQQRSVNSCQAQITECCAGRSAQPTSTATRSSQDRAASNLCPPHLQHRKSAAVPCSKPGQQVRHLSLAPCLPAKAILSI